MSEIEFHFENCLEPSFSGQNLVCHVKFGQNLFVGVKTIILLSNQVSRQNWLKPSFTVRTKIFASKWIEISLLRLNLSFCGQNRVPHQNQPKHRL